MASIMSNSPPTTTFGKTQPSRFFSLARTSNAKGLPKSLTTLALVHNAGHPCPLRVIGRDDPVSFTKQAVRLNVLNAISFEGPTKKIQEAYQSSDLFVFPSLYDPFANVVLESLACGLPALTTTTNGSSEIITQDTDRYVMKGATDHLAKDLADRIQEFCKLSPDERSMMRKAAIERATAMSDGESLFTSIKSPNLDAEKS